MSCHPECPDPIRHVTTHYIKMMRQQKLIHSLTLTRARAWASYRVYRLLHAPANMQFLSQQDTEHPECVYCPHSLAHSFSHFSLISSATLADSQIFTADYRKNGNKSGLTFGVSPFPASGDSWDTQLSTEARDETALIIIVTTRPGLLGKRIYE